MKIRNIPITIGLVCVFIMISMNNSSIMIGDEIADNFSKLGYKPVADVRTYVNEDGGLFENSLYKEWCEETFDNGKYIYEAYKYVAFNIKYTPEPKRTDYWQTPIETARLKRGDCEDAVLFFFSQIPSNQKNAEIVWGWVIDNRSEVAGVGSGRGKAHVWYQLTDKKGHKYVVESFSKDWNGIIPVDIVQNHETRSPILSISHCMVSKLSSLFSEVESWQKCKTLTSMLGATNFISQISGKQFFSNYTSIRLSLSDHEFIKYPVDTQSTSRNQTQFMRYSPRYKSLPKVKREVSHIFDNLHEVFTRYDSQKNEDGTTMWISLTNDMKQIYHEGNLRCRR